MQENAPIYKEKSMASSTFWWSLDIRGDKGILGIVLWCSGILLIALPFIMGIWGPYMASALMISSVVIGQFLIWFFWMASFKVCVDGHTTICFNIISSYTPLIYRL